MADDDGVMKIKTIRKFKKGNKKIEAVLAQANHVKRGLQGVLGAKEHIDASRTSLNYSLHGLNDAIAVNNYVNGQIAHAGIKVQKNHVLLISVVFSLPVAWHEKDTRAYFKDCYEWVKKAFDCELITFDVHLDESCPHAHALLLPIIEDIKTGRKKLGGSYILGGTPKFTGYGRSFFNDVAVKHGFKSKNGNLNPEEKAQLANDLLRYAERLNDPMLKSDYFQTIRDFIYKYPEKFAGKVGLVVENKKGEDAFIK